MKSPQDSMLSFPSCIREWTIGRTLCMLIILNYNIQSIGRQLYYTKTMKKCVLSSRVKSSRSSFEMWRTVSQPYIYLHQHCIMKKLKLLACLSNQRNTIYIRGSKYFYFTNTLNGIYQYSKVLPLLYSVMHC